MSENKIFKYDQRAILKDVFTGFKGAVTGRLQFVNGCVRYQIQPTGLKDGKPIEAHWVDEEQLKLIKAAPIPKVDKRPTGGPVSVGATSKTAPTS